MEPFEVEYYSANDGSEPVKEFIDELSKKMQLKILSDLLVLQQLGNMVREPYSKYLEDGIFELRSKVATDAVRILYFFNGGRVVVLTNGFVKKRRKTPRKEIELAKKHRDDYLKREAGDDDAE